MELNRKILDAENNLTKERIASLLKMDKDWDKRPSIPKPENSLVDLMHWVKFTYLFDVHNDESVDNIICVINNVISIDGSFVQFCELNNTKIKTLHVDSVFSQKTESGTESFQIQGVFKITYQDFTFIHAALFHKGDKFKDEISYFVLIDKIDYNKYIEFRNIYTAWKNDRMTKVLEVKVFGGKDYIYEKSKSWNDLFLPVELKKEIKLSVEDFLNSEKEFKKYNLPWKRGIILHGPPGGGKTSLINTIISEYNLKPVTVSGENIGDFASVLTEAFKYAEQNSPSLLFLEELDALLENSNDARVLTELLDGVNPINGIIIIATTNNLKELKKKKNIIDRPSRFDRKWRIPLPDEGLALRYLKKWFSKSNIDSNVLKSFVKSAVEYKFSYAHLKELYITSMFIARQEKQKHPNIDIMNKALNIIVGEKSQASNIEEEDTSSGNFGF